MVEAAAVVGGDGAVGEAEIEEEPAVFEDGGLWVVGEEGFDGTRDGLCGRSGGSGGRHQLRWSASAALRSSEKLPAHTLS
jgi:hypothetical protein